MPVEAHRLKLHTKYARYYDLFFRDGYPAAAGVIDWIIKRHRRRETADLLDIMCGSGGHLTELAQRGYRRLVGIDASRPMVRLARERAKEFSQVKIVLGDVREMKFKSEFDVAYCWFNSMQYFFDDASLIHVLGRIRKSLRPDGLFIVDMRNPVTFFPFIQVLRKQLPKDFPLDDGPLHFVNRVRDIAYDHRSRIATYYTEFIIEGPIGRQRESERHSYRLIPLTEFEKLLKQAGLLFEAVYGDSMDIDVPFDEHHSEKMVVVSHRE